MNEALLKLLSKPVASVPDTGRVAFGLSRNSSYEAAKRGEIETIPFGKKRVVSTTWIRKKLGIEAVPA